jgi:hypothetical protein
MLAPRNTGGQPPWPQSCGPQKSVFELSETSGLSDLTTRFRAITRPTEHPYPVQDPPPSLTTRPPPTSPLAPTTSPTTDPAPHPPTPERDPCPHHHFLSASTLVPRPRPSTATATPPEHLLSPFSAPAPTQRVRHPPHMSRSASSPLLQPPLPHSRTP